MDGNCGTGRTRQASAQVSRWDWSQIKTLAYGVLELKPSEFWNMTYGEFLWMLRARAERVEESMELAAWSVRWAMAPHCKNVPSIDEMLGRKPDVPRLSREDRRKTLKHAREGFRIFLAKGKN